jgi:hypothetical protein
MPELKPDEEINPGIANLMRVATLFGNGGEDLLALVDKRIAETVDSPPKLILPN